MHRGGVVIPGEDLAVGEDGIGGAVRVPLSIDCVLIFYNWCMCLSVHQRPPPRAFPSRAEQALGDVVQRVAA